jgi:hypothetical protein
MAVSVDGEFATEFFPSAFAFGGDMVNFDQIVVSKGPFTPSAFSMISLKKSRKRAREYRIVPQSFGPIDRVSIVGAGCSFYLNVPLNGFSGVLVQLYPFFGSKVPVSCFQSPVFCCNPVTTFLWVPTFGPSPELCKHQRRHFPEDLC